MESLTESMFYVLLALKTRPMCGMEIATGFAGYQEIFHAVGDKG